jgi:hypothetical protein
MLKRIILLSALALAGCGDDLPPTCPELAEEMCDQVRSCRGFEPEHDGLWERCHRAVSDLCEDMGPDGFDTSCEAIETCSAIPGSDCE